MTAANPNRDRIIPMYESGMSVTEIAEQLGYASSPPVSRWLKINNIPLHDKAHQYDEIVLRMSRAGNTVPQIAKETGISSRSVYAIRRRLSKTLDITKEPPPVLTPRKRPDYSAAPSAIAAALAKAQAAREARA
jgi:DNA-binding NarL/FixJ family response regulator